jgi:hypothetical protein
MQAFGEPGIALLLKTNSVGNECVETPAHAAPIVRGDGWNVGYFGR